MIKKIYEKNSPGYQNQCIWACHQLQATSQVVLEVHNLMQDQGSKIPPHQPSVPNLQTKYY